jgi:hypothetical protein
LRSSDFDRVGHLPRTGVGKFIKRVHDANRWRPEELPLNS